MFGGIGGTGGASVVLRDANAAEKDDLLRKSGEESSASAHLATAVPCDLLEFDGEFAPADSLLNQLAKPFLDDLSCSVDCECESSGVPKDFDAVRRRVGLMGRELWGVLGAAAEATRCEVAAPSSLARATAWEDSLSMSARLGELLCPGECLS